MPTIEPIASTPSTRPPEASTRHAVVDSTLGPLTLVGEGTALTGLFFPAHWTRPDPLSFGECVDLDDDALLATAATQLHHYLAGGRREFDLPLAPHGTERARELWALLAAVPYGSTTTYGALATRLGGGISARAVGGYVGHNPLSIVVPCHRVVGATGALTGYAGGLDRKRRLLELEGAMLPLPVG